MLDTLYSVLKNISGASRFFSYLSAHGATLANNGEYSEPGDINTRLATQARIRGGRMGMWTAFHNDLEEGRLAWVKSPLVVLYDETQEESRQLALDAETLGTVAVEWA